MSALSRSRPELLRVVPDSRTGLFDVGGGMSMGSSVMARGSITLSRLSFLYSLEPFALPSDIREACAPR